MSYIAPMDRLTFLLEEHPDLLVGGLQNHQDRAENLRAFWQAYKLQHADHRVYQEHQDSLQTVVPIAWHGDEGRGKRRGKFRVRQSSVFTQLCRRRGLILPATARPRIASSRSMALCSENYASTHVAC